MSKLSIETVYAAQSGDRTAHRTICDEFAAFIGSTARDASTSYGGKINADEVDDFTQDGYLALLEALPRFTGDNVAGFMSFIFTSIKGAVSNKARTQYRQGVSHTTADRFHKAMKMAFDEGGDSYTAMVIASDKERMGANVLSPATANAARMAYMGSDRLDRTVDSETGPMTLGETLISTIGLPEDLIEASDVTAALNKEERNQDRRHLPPKVRALLAEMTETQSVILAAITGVDPVEQYPVDKAGDAELAADYRLNAKSVAKNRNTAKATFSRKWVAQHGEWK